MADNLPIFKNEYPVYKCIIDEDVDSQVQVEYVALVDKPAIMKNFLAFNEEKMKFAVDEERKVIYGPAMIADMLIYRNTEDLGEFYTVFDKESILSIVQKFFKKGFIHNFNIMHDSEQKTSGVTIYESFITNSNLGIMPMKGFEDVPDGSWFIGVKIDDENIWSDIKEGKLKGFSVEGLFKQIPIKIQKFTTEQVLEQIKNLLEFWEPESNSNN